MSEITTQFRTTSRLDRCADTESGRYALSSVHVCPTTESGKVRLTATDGRVLASARVDGFTDQALLCPREVMPRKKSGGTVEKNFVWRNTDGKWTSEQPDGRFPSVADVFTSVDNGYLQLCLDARLLSNLAEALSDGESNTVKLLLQPPAQGSIQIKAMIGVLGSNTSAIGLLAPVSSDEDGHVRYNAEIDKLRADWKLQTSGKED